MVEENRLGQRIRALRRQRQLRLEDVARACGFTKSLLSKIENGRTVPPMATAANIAKALGVPLPALLESGPSARTAVTRADVGEVATDKGYRVATLAAGRPDKAMQPLRFSARRGGVRRRPVSHPGQEFVYVLTGTLKYRVGDVEYTLRPGDNLYFDASEDHDFAPSTATATWLGVFLDPGRG